ncbi:HEAT repeat domain-containing protein [Actinoplanes philippinensis]|uniref:HEAT repeat domain-containing protein n=1 Tax=Actinoplanes philippinensis TaxID=35752 RepID=UPI0033F03BE2
MAGRQRPGVEQLLSQLGGTDSDAVRSAALELGDRREYGAVPTMLEILGATPDASVRNGVALALSDMRIPEAFEVIVELLQQDRTYGARGTLLYALRPFDCVPILPLLVDLVIKDTWESAREAAYLISEVEVVSAETWAPLNHRLLAAYEAVDPSYAAKDPERREVIRFLIGFFEDEPDEPA